MERIFFLRHGHESSTKEIKGIVGATQLIASSFPPLWDPLGLAAVLELFTDLTTQVPMQELSIRPDQSAIELVKRICA